jgi:Family of unknown function (DUF6527)
MRVKRVHPSYYEEGYEFKCPGCGWTHAIPVQYSAKNIADRGGAIGPQWSFNGSLDRPTFNPSLLVRGTEDLTDDEYDRVMRGEKIQPRPRVCHSFIRDGQIQFLSDCTHALAGKTVDLAEIAAVTG